MRHDYLNITAGIRLVFRLKAELVGHLCARFEVFWENFHIVETTSRGCIFEATDFSKLDVAGPIIDRNAERLCFLDVVRVPQLD